MIFFKRKKECRTKINSKVTLIIKTFKREEALEKLYFSIRKRYKDIQILIADDGHKESKPSEQYKNDSNCIRYFISYDSGLSAGRNYLINKVETKYFLLLDDDFVFYKKTKIEKFLNIIENNDVDILGGRIKEKDEYLHYEHKLDLSDGVLTYRPEPLSSSGNIIYYDIVLNFFIAETESIKQFGGWDNRLKLQEHTEFFLRMRKNGLKVAYCPEIIIKHERIVNEDYNNFRNRNYAKIWQEEYGVKEVVRM